MKRIFILTICFLLTAFTLLFCSLVWAADTYTVTQSGGGANYSVVGFNALNGTTYAGDTFYFSGTITSQITVGISGTSGNNVILDGYQAGSCDPINAICSSSALIDRNNITHSYGIFIENEDYIDVQDFRITECDSAIRIYNGSDHINIKRNYIYDILGTAVQMNTNVNNITVGGSVTDGNNCMDIGHTTAHEDIEMYQADNIIISHNKLWANDPLGVEADRGIDGFVVVSSNNILIEYNEIFGHNNTSGTKGSLVHGHGENGIDVKGYSYNVIIRFNEIYDHTVHWTTSSDAIIHSGTHHIYIYGNYCHDSLTGVQLWSRGTNNHNYFVWANIFSKHVKAGLTATCTDASMSDVYVRNNTLYDESDADDGYALYIATSVSGINVRNNLFLDNQKG